MNKEQRYSQQEHYDKILGHSPDPAAINRFKRPPAYQAQNLIHEQARQMDAAEYLEEKGVDIDGQVGAD